MKTPTKRISFSILSTTNSSLKCNHSVTLLRTVGLHRSCFSSAYHIFFLASLFCCPLHFLPTSVFLCQRKMSSGMHRGHRWPHGAQRLAPNSAVVPCAPRAKPAEGVPPSLDTSVLKGFLQAMGHVIPADLDTVSCRQGICWRNRHEGPGLGLGVIKFLHQTQALSYTFLTGGSKSTAMLTKVFRKVLRRHKKTCQHKPNKAQRRLDKSLLIERQKHLMIADRLGWNTLEIYSTGSMENLQNMKTYGFRCFISP